MEHIWAIAGWFVEWKIPKQHMDDLGVYTLQDLPLAHTVKIGGKPGNMELSPTSWKHGSIFF